MKVTLLLADLVCAAVLLYFDAKALAYTGGELSPAEISPIQFEDAVNAGKPTILHCIFRAYRPYQVPV